MGANDDLPATATSLPQRGSRIEDALIEPGQTLVVVASTFLSTPIGSFTIEVLTDVAGEVPSVISIPMQISQSITTAGTLHVTDPSWDRLGEDCQADADTALVPFDEVHIRNDTGTKQNIRITVHWLLPGANGFVHVFFTDVTPRLSDQCLSGNNDFLSSAQSRCDTMTNAVTGTVGVPLDIFPDEQLLVVASAFFAGDAVGPYTIDVEVVP